MFAICVESSHARGMGHLFRMLNLINYLKAQGEQFIVCTNHNQAAQNILKRGNIPFETVELTDFESDWETTLIGRNGIRIWINDRLNTHASHAENVKKNKVLLVTMEDRGSGAKLSDYNFAGLCFPQSNQELQGNHVFTGLDYLILNKEIDRFKRRRTEFKKIVVSLGGSDTYGVTVKITEILKRAGRGATIVVGPSFDHKEELERVIDQRFEIKSSVPSLVEEFSHYDLAITGGGITPFEANAAGLPCIIVANEQHEIPNGLFLHDLGSSVFSGYYRELDESIFSKDLDIKRMSQTGLDHIHTKGVDHIYRKIKDADWPQ